MKTRILGNTGLKLSVVGLGTALIGEEGHDNLLDPLNDKDALETIITAQELGVNWIDTAPRYGRGYAEKIIGESIKMSKMRPIISTKCGFVLKNGKEYNCIDPESVRLEVESSLSRMGVDFIDLYQIHKPLPDKDIEKAWVTILKLRDEGKIRYAGVSNFDIKQLQRIMAIHPVDFVQVHYSILTRNIENGLLDYCVKNKIGVLAHSPIETGILSGEFNWECLEDVIPKYNHRWKNPLFRDKDSLEFVEYLCPIVLKNRISLAQLAIAWALRKPEITAAITSARFVSQIKETSLSADLVLSDECLSEIEGLLKLKYIKSSKENNLTNTYRGKLKKRILIMGSFCKGCNAECLYCQHAILSQRLKDISLRISRSLRLTYKVYFCFGLKFLLKRRAIIRNILHNLLKKKQIAPTQIHIAVYHDCNLKCLYCFEHSKLNSGNKNQKADENYLYLKLNRNIFKKFIDDLSVLNRFYNISIPGRIGEPFCHKDFIKMLGYMKLKLPNAFVSITSNGTLITEKQGETLVDLGINHLNISVVSGRDETYREITGAPLGVFERVVNLVKSISEYRNKCASMVPKIQLTSVICSLNYKEVLDIIKIGLRVGADSVGFHRMYFCERKKSQMERLILKDKEIEELKSLLLEAAILAQKNKLKTNIAFFLALLNKEKPGIAMAYQRRPWLMKNMVTVLADGAVYAGEYEEVLGNINQESFINIWYSDRYRFIRSNINKFMDNNDFPCNFSCKCCGEPLYKSRNKQVYATLEKV